jgi:hypothetical protein
MPRVDGSLARQMDFEEMGRPGAAPNRPALRLGHRPRLLRGPNKYQVLERRRRLAQMAARRVLDLIE